MTRDETFTLYPEARALAQPPFTAEFLAKVPPSQLRRWRITDAAGGTFGHARTRAGARAAVVQLYADQARTACAEEALHG